MQQKAERQTGTIMITRKRSACTGNIRFRTVYEQPNNMKNSALLQLRKRKTQAG